MFLQQLNVNSLLPYLEVPKGLRALARALLAISKPQILLLLPHVLIKVLTGQPYLPVGVHVPFLTTSFMSRAQKFMDVYFIFLTPDVGAGGCGGSAFEISLEGKVGLVFFSVNKQLHCATIQFLMEACQASLTISPNFFSPALVL